MAARAAPSSSAWSMRACGNRWRNRSTCAGGTDHARTGCWMKIRTTMQSGKLKVESKSKSNVRDLLFTSEEVARLSSALLDQTDITDDHRLVHRLDHVVDGQGRHGNGGERLHLNARLAAGANARLDGVSRFRGRQLYPDMCELQGMAEWNERGGALGGHDPGKASGLKRVAFCDRAAANQPERLGAHRDGPARHRLARRDGLVADV